MRGERELSGRSKATGPARAETQRNPLAAARFTISCARAEQLPSTDTGEVGFAGRSNAGKSSALNVLVGQQQLARVSKTPGRTQLINYFDVPSLGRLVDLPGYGYAKVPEAMRRSWAQLVGGYLQARENLRGLIVLMDIRHPHTDLDRQLLDFARHRQLPSHVLLTKADKLGYGAAKGTLQKVTAELQKLAMPVTAQLFSATAKQGLEEARSRVVNWLSEPAADHADKKMPGDSGGESPGN
jgi:GTP-binding protein